MRGRRVKKMGNMRKTDYFLRHSYYLISTIHLPDIALSHF